MDGHDGGRGGPCNTCGCAAGNPPSAFEVGVIHSLHDLTVAVLRLAQAKQAGK